MTDLNHIFSSVERRALICLRIDVSDLGFVASSSLDNIFGRE